MDQVIQFLMSHGGPVLFAIVLAEQAGLPFPSAPWLLAAGALAAGGKLNPVSAIGLAALACVLADSFWFFVGRRGGQRVLRFFCRLSLARNACVGRTKGLFDRHGLQTIVLAKFLPGLGAVMPPLAGALGVSARRFFLFDSLGSLFYGGSYVAAGFFFHNQLRQVLAVLNQLGLSALLLVLILIPGYIAFKLARRNRTLTRRTEEPLPLAQSNPLRAGDPGLDTTAGTETLQNPALAFTGGLAQPIAAHAPAPFPQLPL